VNECSNGIFSLLKKEYDTPRARALAATARMKQMPFLIEQGKRNLTKPVRLYAQLAIDSARSIDSLFTDSLMTLATGLSLAEKAVLVKVRDAAIASIHGFADWLEIVNLHTGRWTFAQAVKYFMEAGGLDREAAEGEAAGAASAPTQKITYITGKWQIMRLLGRYRDRQGASFRLGQFHGDLLKNGSLPLSIVEWILLDDPTDSEVVILNQ
jgi:Bacterial protein of unknown function (DUF885)